MCCSNAKIRPATRRSLCPSRHRARSATRTNSRPIRHDIHRPANSFSNPARPSISTNCSPSAPSRAMRSSMRYSRRGPLAACCSLTVRRRSLRLTMRFSTMPRTTHSNSAKRHTMSHRRDGIRLRNRSCRSETITRLMCLAAIPDFTEQRSMSIRANRADLSNKQAASAFGPAMRRPAAIILRQPSSERLSKLCGRNIAARA